MKLKVSQKEYLLLKKLNEAGFKNQISRTDLNNFLNLQNIPAAQAAWLISNVNFRGPKGMIILPNIYNLEYDGKAEEEKTEEKNMVKETKVTYFVDNTTEVRNTKLKEELEKSESTSSVRVIMGSECSAVIPPVDPLFVPFGCYEGLNRIISSRVFHPAYIHGDSGNGKTYVVEQISAALNRSYIRIPITIESDEDSLIGGFRLINGETVFQLGPVIEAMMTGSVLLLDEVDKASSKIMCLQPILEGKPIFIKKINKVVYPEPGFNIIATANTKGSGSEDNGEQFITSMILDEAFLERFAVLFHQEYPDEKIEIEIMNRLLKSFNMEDTSFTKLIVSWAGETRKSYKDKAVNHCISTRRLTHIIRNYAIFGQDGEKAVELAVNRFDTSTRMSFMELFKLKNPKTVKIPKVSKSPIQTKNDPDDRPF